MGKVNDEIVKVHREEYSRLLAVLIRLFGAHNIELAEDVLQEAFAKAQTQWQEAGVPDNPGAWLVKVAKNKAIDVIRQYKTQQKFADDIAFQLESEWTLGHTINAEFQQHRVQDDQLKMIFLCCGCELPAQDAIPLTLKSLCGFTLHAVARAMILPEETVKKRLFRAREKLQHSEFTLPSPAEKDQALYTVHTVIYLLFNEGFHSSDNDCAVKHEFCDEAIRFGQLLISNPRTANKETFSLLALMHFLYARIFTKVDTHGAAIPLDEQDRSRWDHEKISRALDYLNFGERLEKTASNRFFLEAQIAKEHALAQSFFETSWQKIVLLYEQLIAETGSPVAQLNQAIALAYAGHLEEAISQVRILAEQKSLTKNYMPDATLAHLYAKQGNKPAALEHAQCSATLGGTAREHSLLKAKILRLLEESERRF